MDVMRELLVCVYVGNRPSHSPAKPEKAAPYPNNEGPMPVEIFSPVLFCEIRRGEHVTCSVCSDSAGRTLMQGGEREGEGVPTEDRRLARRVVPLAWVHGPHRLKGSANICIVGA
ncbi:hypothetical protein E2C01_038550 [Portunus trituberculatus]|uniref:Uncharacterized protein n=1 Tax=Portunus trituberculatus TaxID=210409 RepID=A0A5B7FI82_PORTR|nr:hypothetical protein [Portunus trituberculatus]